MKRIISIIIIAILIGIFIYIVTFFVIYFFQAKSVTVEELDFFQVKERLYLVQFLEGRNYKITSISQSKKRKVNLDENKSFVYSAGETLFYSINADTLVVYTMSKANVPKEFSSKIVVKQIEITNLKFIELKKNYKKMGLKKFPEDQSL